MARNPKRAAMKRVGVYPATEPSAPIGRSYASRRAQVGQFSAGANDDEADAPESLAFILAISRHVGDISGLLPPGDAERIGLDAEREWRIDLASRERWERTAERGLKAASQDYDDDENEDAREGPWEDGSDVHYPILTQAALEFDARAYPELVKGDKAVGVKVFTPQAQSPTASQIAQDSPPPQNPMQAQAMQQGAQAATQQAGEADLAAKQRAARGERVAHYMNWLIFYKLPSWEEESDLLLLESSVAGIGFKKVYFDAEGLQSDYVSALRLTVHNDTKSLTRCPRVTQDFDVYPYEVDRGIRAGRYREIDLPAIGEDKEASRLFIEQHRMEDLDGDGVSEPYIVTVDVETKQTMRIEAAFGPEDVVLTDDGTRVARIDRWLPYPKFMFLPDPRGRFYGMGLARLLEDITASIDTTINQLIDAGTAQITGGGFIGSSVRLQGSGQAGAAWFRPGEYQVVGSSGQDLRQAIWERTIPEPSQVAFSMLEFLLGSAKDLASVKDVISGDAPSTAPVGTTLALQNQALQVFSSIYKRIYRGFRDEYRLMFRALRKWGGDRERREYQELTGGDFDQDFAGDGTDIQPVADPSVVTKMQKISRFQTLLQLSESPTGMAAGMQMPGPAQTIVQEGLEILDWDRPERFVAQVPPNPELVAKVQEMAANTALKQADAQLRLKQATVAGAKANLDNSKTVETMGNVAEKTHAVHQEAERVSQEGLLPPPEPEAEAA